MHSWLESNWILQMRTWRKRSGTFLFPSILHDCCIYSRRIALFYINENRREGGAIFMVLDCTSFLTTASDILQGGSRGNEEGTSRREETFQWQCQIVWLGCESCSGFSSGPLDLYILAAVVGSKLSKLELWHGATCNETPVRFCCGHVFFCAS